MVMDKDILLTDVQIFDARLNYAFHIKKKVVKKGTTEDCRAVCLAQLKKIITELEKVGEIFVDGESEAICIPIECWNEIKKEVGL